MDETLIIVSADHSHTFSIGAYGRRGDSVFGLGTAASVDGEDIFICKYFRGYCATSA